MRTPILLLLPRRSGFPRAFSGVLDQQEFLKAVEFSAAAARDGLLSA
jgi:hypothetical protein